jgi:hypothetical protein
MNPSVNFSEDWNNKLSCKIFSTIRKLTAEKLDYYLDNFESVFDINLMGVKACEARIIGLKTCRLSDIPDHMLWLDTGCSTRGEALEIFKSFGVDESTEVIWLFFRREI